VGHRLVGSTPDGQELGDRLLPYVVAETVDDYSQFAALGVVPLDDPGSASVDTLLRFLAAVGKMLVSS
jgi:hypothetical protein